MLSIACLLFALFTFMPAIGTRHWSFKVFEFVRVQVFVLQVLLLIVWSILMSLSSALELASGALLLVSTVWQFSYFRPFLSISKTYKADEVYDSFTILVSNVFMENEHHERLIDQVNELSPDLLLTLESNGAWQEHLDKIPGYDYAVKVPYENTYGMHLYSKYKIVGHTVHCLVDDDCPCIEAELDINGRSLSVYCFHPKPPSPTEEADSVQRDLAFRKLGRLLQEHEQNKLVIGDFNAVAWSQPIQRFLKATGLRDPRKGRGLLSTFHADYFFLRFPIDQVLHSQEMDTSDMKVLPNIGSDHFPLFAKVGFTTNA